MRGRIVLLVVLAVVIGLVGIYALWSTNTPKAVGEPLAATPSDSSVRSIQGRPPRSPTTSSPKVGSPKVGTKPGGNTTPPGRKPPTPPASTQKPNTDPVRFGKVTTTPSGATTSIAPDRRALATTFSDRLAEVGNGELTKPDATRSFAMTLPLSDGAKGETLWVHVQGFAAVFEGASARLTLKLNGQETVSYFRAGSEDSYVQTLKVPASPATTYRLSGVVEVHQDPGTKGTALLNVLSIDSEIRR